VQAILDTVISVITYDYSELNNDSTNLIRDIDALTLGKGVCQHYAAVFVSIARAVGLPAQVVAGKDLSFDTKKARPKRMDMLG